MTHAGDHEGVGIRDFPHVAGDVWVAANPRDRSRDRVEVSAAVV
jgi:hypothetical protein